VSSRKSG